MWGYLDKTANSHKIYCPNWNNKKKNAQDNGFQDNGHQSLKESDSMENRNKQGVLMTKFPSCNTEKGKESRVQ